MSLLLIKPGELYAHNILPSISSFDNNKLNYWDLRMTEVSKSNQGVVTCLEINKTQASATITHTN